MPKPKNRRNGFYFKGKKAYPSVTTILQAIAKPALMAWAAKISARAALANPELSEQEATSVVYAKRDKAGDLGSTVHSFVEAFKNGHTPVIQDVDLPHIPYCRAFIKFMAEHPFTFIEHEKEVYSDAYKYAGTLDILASDLTGGKWVLDVKTSGGVYPEYGLQLKAYAEALKENIGGEYRMGIIHLKDDETYSFFEVNEPFGVFLATMQLWKWMEKDKIEEVNKFALMEHKEKEVK